MKIGRTTTREERLGWQPVAAVALVRGPSPDETPTVALAMFDQLVAAHLSIDTIEMALVFWSRALDGLPPGPAPPPRLARLDHDLSLLTGASPVLASWISALRSAVATAHDLDWVIRFLMQAHQTWKVTVSGRSDRGRTQQPVRRPQVQGRPAVRTASLAGLPLLVPVRRAPASAMSMVICSGSSVLIPGY